MKKNGFVSAALIYTFFIVFLVLMVFLLNNYSSTRFIIDRYRDDIEEELFELSNADINVYVFVWNNRDKEYKYIDHVPESAFKDNISYCKNGALISFEEGKIKVNSKGKDFCYAYFEQPNVSITSPTITSSDGKASDSWHNDSVTLSFGGSTIINDTGTVVYHYGTEAYNLNETGESVQTTSDEGTTSYYVKACSSLDEFLCSEIEEYILKIDKTEPTVSFSISNQTATYTCSNGGSGSPLTGTTSGSQALRGTSNYKYSATCTDEAGNAKTDSHTYTYSSCLTGVNTCQSGYVYGTWHSVTACLYDGAISTDTLICSGACDATTGRGTCRTRSKTYSTCATGSNTCQAGFRY